MCRKHLVGVQEVEAPCNVQGYAVPQAVPQQPPVCVRLYGTVQVTACSQQQQPPVNQAQA
jgi:hypothetical protein